MSALSIQPTFPIFTETDGQPLENGYIWLGTVNLDPQVNPINVYWDAALTILAPQPIRTINGYPSRNGTPGRLYVNSDYSIRVMNKNGSLVYSAPAATERYGNIINAEDVIYDPPFANAVQTNVEAKLAQTVSVKDFGAVGDGVSDDTAFIQAAINSLVLTGGAVYFPNGKYKVTSQIEVRSIYPIHLYGYMGGQTYNTSTQPNLAGIIIGGNITGSIIKYFAPVGVTRNEGGGGNVSGLSFYDATGSGANPGSYTCTAALELTDFNLSKVENCYFHWINGGAILCGFAVMTNITGNVIRYCGASGKPAIYLNNASTGFTSQSMVISGNKIEVCHGDVYIKMSGNEVNDIKISNNGFEADTSTVGSNQVFVQTSGSRHLITGNSFNRVDAVQLQLDGGDITVSANTFAGGPFTASSIVMNGGRIAVVGNNFVSTRKKYEIEVIGNSNTCVISSNTFYYSGVIFIDGPYTTVCNNVIVDSTADPAEFATTDRYLIQTNPAAPAINAVVISGNNISKTNAPPFVEFGGIRIAESAGLVANNMIKNFNTSGEGGIGIRNESSETTIVGNVGADVSTLVSTTAYSELVLSGNNQTPAFVNFPLMASATYDPPSLADGAGVTTTIVVTGAAVGDFVDAAFSQDLQGITLTAYAYQNDGVAVRFQNESGGVVDLASGTLRVIVRKR